MSFFITNRKQYSCTISTALRMSASSESTCACGCGAGGGSDDVGRVRPHDGPGSGHRSRAHPPRRPRHDARGGYHRPTACRHRPATAAAHRRGSPLATGQRAPSRGQAGSSAVDGAVKRLSRERHFRESTCERPPVHTSLLTVCQ